jgi:hypothetical protein
MSFRFVVTRACEKFRSENAEFSREGPLPAQSVSYRLVTSDSTSSWQPRANDPRSLPGPEGKQPSGAAALTVPGRCHAVATAEAFGPAKPW